MTPSLFKKKSSETRSNEVEASGASSRSLHFLPTLSEEKYPKLPDSPQVTLAQELTTTLISSSPSSLSIDSRNAGYLFSSASNSPTSLCHSSMSPNLSRLKIPPFISESLKEKGSSHSSQPSPSVSRESQFHYNEVENFRDFVSSEETAKRTNWREWADQLVTVDDSLDLNLSDLLVDVNVPDLDAKVCFSIMFSILICFSFI